MAKTIDPSKDELLAELIKIHIPAIHLSSFDLHSVKEKSDCYELILHEKESCIPQELVGKSGIVLDGFCDSVSVLSHSFSLKKIYLIFRRRRWKLSNRDKHYSNTYNFHPPQAKLTHQLALFFKGGH